MRIVLKRGLIKAAKGMYKLEPAVVIDGDVSVMTWKGREEEGV